MVAEAIADLITLWDDVPHPQLDMIGKEVTRRHPAPLAFGKLAVPAGFQKDFLRQQVRQRDAGRPGGDASPDCVPRFVCQTQSG